jgi:topoisomerase-4 subunit A
VIGKYHPHGDSACYEALVLMAQPFSYRYPLIEGQGNFGSQDDPKSFAAMRYTESKLTPIAEVLLGELGQGTVDWTPNFDGTLEEPTGCRRACRTCCSTAPPALPLAWRPTCRRTTSTKSSAPASACSTIPDATVRDLCEHVRGPDYPTAPKSSPRRRPAQMYETGNGSVRARATWVRRNTTSSSPRCPTRSARQDHRADRRADAAKKLPWLEDIRDESDHANPVRLVLVPRSNRVDPSS